jgi:hypothetical protein
MLNFAELGGNGRGLEQLVRELLLLLGMDPQWSGEGPDGGRDLLFEEHGVDLLGSKRRTWLVSCKDNATSGRAVGADALNGLVEEVEQHGAQGFLLVCTTHPSAAAVERLRAIEVSRGIATHIWDGVTLERLLSTPRAWAVAQQFMPTSTDAAGWRIFGTESPNRWVAVHRGHYFRLSSRVAGGPNFDLQSFDKRIEELISLEPTVGVQFRIRGIWHDDAHGGGYVWYVDCMVPKGAPLPEAESIEKLLSSGVSREDGQFHTFRVMIRSIDWGSDHFDIDHYAYYDRLPPFV